MSRLGEFGAAQRELDPAAERDSFGFFGEEFQIVGKIPAVLMLSLAASVAGNVTEAQMSTAIWDTLRLSLDEPDPEEGVEPAVPPVKQFERLRQSAVKHNCDLESLMKLTMALFQAQDGRPTEAVPGSGPGPLSISPSSSTSSSTPPVSILTPLPGMRMVSEVLGIQERAG